MARSIIASEQWERAREYFEHGLSLGDIEKRTGITKGAISKKSKAEEWDKESPKKRLLSQAVEVSAAKETLKETAAKVHDELYDEKTRYLKFIKNATLKNLSVMMDKVNHDLDIGEHKATQDTLDKGAITLGVADRYAPKGDINVSANAAAVPQFNVTLTKKD